MKKYKAFKERKQKEIEIEEELKYESDPRKIRSYPREYQQFALKAYKNIVKKRIEGIGELRAFLIEFLEKDPDVNDEKIIEAVREIVEEHYIPFDVFEEKFSILLENYRKLRKRINNQKVEDIHKLLKRYGEVFDENVGKVIKKTFCVEVRGGVSDKKYNADLGKYEIIEKKYGGATYKGDVHNFIYDKEKGKKIVTT